METATGPPTGAPAKPADGGRSRAARTHAARAAAREAKHADPVTAPRRRAREPVAPAPSATYLLNRIGALVDTLAPALGLDPARVHVAIVPSASSLRGRADPGSITL